MKQIVTQNKNKTKLDKYEILKNKEIIIYKNGEEFKRFKQSESKEINEDELYILDFLLKKYSEFEVPLRFSKIEKEKDFEFESAEDFYKKRQGRNTMEISEDEDRRTEPKLKEYFKDIEEVDDLGKEGMTEIKKLKKGIITKEDQKVPIKRKNKELNYHYEVENVDIENEEEEESEEPPQYIIEAESYTSPSFKDVNENYAEEALLNGIKISLMLNGKEKKGIIFLGENEKLIFVCFEDKKETIIPLNNIKRIYFNIKGSSNLRNYKKKGDSERFIQFVEYKNNNKSDFKFNNNDDFEFFIKGLIQTFKNKSTIIDKNIIYERNKKYFTTNKSANNTNIKTPNNKRSFDNMKEKSIKYEKSAKNSFRTKKNEKPIDYSNYSNRKNNRQNNYYYSNRKNPKDDLITTTVTEIYKGGKLINEETKEESGGVVKTLHSYSPDIKEYKEYLRKSKYRRRNEIDEDLNKSIERVNKYNKGYW